MRTLRFSELGSYRNAPWEVWPPPPNMRQTRVAVAILDARRVMEILQTGPCMTQPVLGIVGPYLPFVEGFCRIHVLRGVPEILTVAHVSHGQHSVKALVQYGPYLGLHVGS